MRKNKHIGSTLDDFLEEEDLTDRVEEQAVKKIIALQLRGLLEEQELTKAELARRLRTSRAAVDRLLDPGNESVTLHTLERAARVLGKRLKLQII